MFYDNFISICETKGFSPSRVLTNLSISRGSLGRWKEGGEPRNEYKKAIADYLEITVAELMSGNSDIKKEKPTTDNGNELSNNEREFLDLIRRIPPEKLSQVEDYAKFLLNNQ